MYQQDSRPVPAAPPAGATAPEFYLPLGSGIDPDLYVPEERRHSSSRLSRWIQSLPVFGGRASRQ